VKYCAVETECFSKWHLIQYSCYCTAHSCTQHTECCLQRVRVGKCHIYRLHAGMCLSYAELDSGSGILLVRLSFLTVFYYKYPYYINKTGSVSLCCKNYCFKTANIKILSTHHKDRSQLPHLYQSVACHKCES